MYTWLKRSHWPSRHTIKNDSSLSTAAPPQLYSSSSEATTSNSQLFLFFLGGEERIYYLQQVRRTPRIFPKALSPQQQNRGSLKVSVHAYSWRGLGHRLSPNLIDITRIREGQHHHSLGSSWSDGRALQANLYHRTGSLYNWFIIFAVVIFLAW